MSIEFSCQQCGKGYKVGDNLAGKRAKCSQCQTVMTIPSAPAAADAGLDWSQTQEAQASQGIPLQQEYNATSVATAPPPQVTTYATARRQAGPEGNIVMSLVGAAAGATLGAVVWFAVAYYTGYEIGYLALLIGILAGYGAIGLGKVRSQTVGVIAALAGLAGIAAGSYAAFNAKVHSDSFAAELFQEMAKQNQSSKTYSSLLPAEKQEWDKTVKEEFVPKISYWDQDAKDLAIMGLFGFLGVSVGYRVGSGKNQGS